MSAALDLIFVYDIPPGLEASDGTQPLVPIQYYTRLSAKIVTALTALTNEGPLYEVDMRLRPSGRSGPLANSLEGFSAYHAQSAWTWGVKPPRQWPAPTLISGSASGSPDGAEG